MPSYKIAPCTAEDGPAVGINNVTAFWNDTNWVLMWKGKTREFVAAQAARRGAHNLLDRTHRQRHQKAIDTETGALVGYIRWLLPEDVSSIGATSPGDLWVEAKVPEVSEEESARFQKEYEAADWNIDPSTDALDPPVHNRKRELLAKKKYALLAYLAVHPDHQGQGIASMLVNSGLEEMSKIGLDAFVVAYKAAIGVYTRAGFKVLDSVIQDDSPYGGSGEWAVYFMEKEAKKQTQVA